MRNTIVTDWSKSESTHPLQAWLIKKTDFECNIRKERVYTEEMMTLTNSSLGLRRPC